ncbi:T9SS type A sorting domain-containing protein [Niastella caeni]|uniref:T9SS type A sorting domain-containing protein n=2 Tax=Niastella caeni TaxID=2569763 RepID=A0A4S8HQB9_9BACT|nr:T9SS type A sorting domain-containing protein [Niastella caeni]
MEVLKNTFKKNPALQARFEAQTQNMRQAINQRKAQLQQLRTEATTIYIPIVFHIVLTNPSVVTDAQIQNQVEQMNKDFAGLNADSTLIPAAFKPLFAKTNIQFRMAQRTPNNEPATGIERTTTTHASFNINDNSVKYASLGGADAWDNKRFFNVWITDLSNGYLGYATFPGSGPDAEDGVVIKYTSLPGGSAPYNKGRTLVHETGHFFYLYHIWGDENGCSGTDFIDDTPNQGTFTSGCPSGAVRTDACTATAPGIMYQNFMDYTDDACMVMYTLDQQERMETSLSLYRASLMTSNGADPVLAFNLDAAAKSINTPLQRICNPSFTPVITLRNRGAQTLTAVTITASIDNGAVTSTTQWTGSLASLAETAVTLNALTVPAEGTHVLNILVSSPNGSTDENTANDAITLIFQYYLPIAPPIAQSFENATFPPVGWDVVNPDLNITWERTLGAAKTGSAAVVMRNFDYQTTGQKDYIRLPVMNITSADSAFMTFQVAAAVASNPTGTGTAFDTLEVLISKDCGATYTSLYKKWGSSLITRSTATTEFFDPTSGEWRKDSVNLTPYINGGPVLLAFANTNENENNIYLDDINVYSLTVNANLKTKGFMITPNPTTGKIAVQFYPNPPLVKGINIFSSNGKLVASKQVNGAGSSSYTFDLSLFSSGVYVVQVILGDKVITQKVIKR